MMKFIWMYLVLAISSFSYGEQIISVPYLVRELSSGQYQETFDDERNPIEFYKSSENEVSAIIWLNEEEEFFENQEGNIPLEILDIHINSPVVREDADINVLEELYGNEQNNYDIAGPFGGGGGEVESILDQQSLEDTINDFLDEDTKNSIVSTFGGGGGETESILDQQLLEEKLNDLLDEDIKNAIVSTFGGGGGFALAQQLLEENNFSEEDVTYGITSTFGGGGYRELFIQRLSEDEMNKILNNKKLKEHQNTQDNFFIYDPSKYLTDERTDFSQDVVGTFGGGGGITPYFEHVSKEYSDNFASAFVVVRGQNLEEHPSFYEDSYVPQSSLFFTEGYPVSRGFIDSNRISPVQINMNGVSFQ